MVERDIYEVANQLGGYIDEATPDPLASFLRRESREAAKLAARIVELEAKVERLKVETFDAATAHGKTKVERNKVRKDLEQAEILISDLRSVIIHLEAQIAELGAEVERLRKKNEYLEDRNEECEHWRMHWKTKVFEALSRTGAATEAEIQRLTTEIARKHGCDRGTFTVCWSKVEKGLPCRCEDEARRALESQGGENG